MKSKTLKTLAAALFVLSAFTTQTQAQTEARTDIPALPTLLEWSVRECAWIWNGAEWRLLPRNEARVLRNSCESETYYKQLTGMLLLDGCYDVPVAAGDKVLLAYRGKFKTYKGTPADETTIEVVRLDCAPGYKPGTLIRTATLKRRGEASATFAENRQPAAVQKCDNQFYVIELTGALAPGRYAVYVPDRAFEFEIAGSQTPAQTITTVERFAPSQPPLSRENQFAAQQNAILSTTNSAAVYATTAPITPPPAVTAPLQNAPATTQKIDSMSKPAPLVGSVWHAIMLYDRAVNRATTELTLTFSNAPHVADGRSGEMHFQAQYEKNNETLRFGEIVIGWKPDAAALSVFETAFLTMLKQVDSWEIEGSVLALKAQGKILALLVIGEYPVIPTPARAT